MQNNVAAMTSRERRAFAAQFTGGVIPPEYLAGGRPSEAPRAEPPTPAPRRPGPPPAQANAGPRAKLKAPREPQAGAAPRRAQPPAAQAEAPPRAKPQKRPASRDPKVSGVGPGEKRADTRPDVSPFGRWGLAPGEVMWPVRDPVTGQVREAAPLRGPIGDSQRAPPAAPAPPAEPVQLPRTGLEQPNAPEPEAQEAHTFFAATGTQATAARLRPAETDERWQQLLRLRPTECSMPLGECAEMLIQRLVNWRAIETIDRPPPDYLVLPGDRDKILLRQQTLKKLIFDFSNPPSQFSRSRAKLDTLCTAVEVFDRVNSAFPNAEFAGPRDLGERPENSALNERAAGYLAQLGTAGVFGQGISALFDEQGKLNEKYGLPALRLISTGIAAKFHTDKGLPDMKLLLQNQDGIGELRYSEGVWAVLKDFEMRALFAIGFSAGFYSAGQSLAVYMRLLEFTDEQVRMADSLMRTCLPSFTIYKMWPSDFALGCVYLVHRLHRGAAAVGALKMLVGYNDQQLLDLAGIVNRTFTRMSQKFADGQNAYAERIWSYYDAQYRLPGATMPVFLL